MFELIWAQPFKCGRTSLSDIHHDPAAFPDITQHVPMDSRLIHPTE
ncbi:MAG: hypothetical protein IH859_08360 [Chloroflexi bacterium]|nr:hypothetical protein [Chloroflexota bacterium]